MRRFDLAALHQALDEARHAQGLTWVEAAGRINAPFANSPSIPISVGTLQGMPRKASVTSAVVLQVLRWLERSPESFLVGPGEGPDALLPEPGPDLILRFDTRALFAALDAQRNARALTWRQLARELPGFTPQMLTNLATGPLIGFPRVMVPTQWLGRPAADFVRGRAG